MALTIALVGRPNVGKSTLFNRLTKSREALVADIPGLTRDRQYGVGKLVGDDLDQEYIVIDSGGLHDNPQQLESLMADQVWQAVAESDVILFIVDGRMGLNAGDELVAQQLRKSEARRLESGADKPVYLVLNKTERLDESLVSSEFYSLGFGRPYAISAAHNSKVAALIEFILSENKNQEVAESHNDNVISVAIIGRPNVGKSTLINRLIGEDRLLTFDMPGTTRDSISVDFEEDGQQYQLIDTAGVRRRGKVKQTIEKFSVLKSIEAIAKANVAIILIDATEGFTDQDANILRMATDSGKALIIGVNKWDGLSQYHRSQVKEKLARSLHFIDFAPIYFVSALHGSKIRDLFDSVSKVYQKAMIRMPTNALSKSLTHAVKKHAPPLVKGHRIRLKFAHQGGQNPPLIIIHGNQTTSVPEAYQRYLINYFRDEFDLKGTPLKLEFKSSDNPYKGRKNILTKHQIAKKLRLKKHNR